jgi:hypothetical protein
LFDCSSLFNHFIQDNEFTDLLKIDRLKPNQKIRCLSEKARVLVLLGRFQVLYSTLHAFLSQLTVALNIAGSSGPFCRVVPFGQAQ